MTHDFDIPGYRIERELGRGGMATVYLALQESLGRRVALKVMSPALAADVGFTERFIREARTIGKIRHPNIVSIYESGLAGFHHFLALEYVPDGDLKHRRRLDVLVPQGTILSPADGKQLPYAAPVYGALTLDPFAIVRQVASALDAAHAKGFIHRDVKPENILFRADGSVVLTDFGIARAEDSGTLMTGTGMSIGTPHYMSPEQARGHKVDRRADLYSLGVVLYEILENKVPYEGQESLSIGIKHITEPVPTLSPPHAHWQPLIDGLMAKAPEDRFQTGATLLAALDQLEAGRPLRACQKTVVMSRIELEKATGAATGTAVPTLRKGIYWTTTGALAAAGLGLVLWFVRAPYAPVGGGGTALVPSEADRVAANLGQKNDAGPLAQVGGVSSAHTAPQAVTAKDPNDPKEIEALLASADADLKAQRLSSPKGANALDRYRAVLERDPANATARDGLTRIVARLIALAKNAVESNELLGAAAYIKTAGSIQADHREVREWKRRIDALIAENQSKPDTDKRAPVPIEAKQADDPAMVARLALARQILETGDLWAAKAKVEEIAQTAAIGVEAGALLRTIDFAIKDRKMQGEALRKRASDAFSEMKFSQTLEFCQEIRRVYPPGLPSLEVCAAAQGEKDKLQQAWQEQNRGAIKVEKR